MYALAAQRHMYEFGTTSAQLAEVKVAASHHAQYNPNALLRHDQHRFCPLSGAAEPTARVKAYKKQTREVSQEP